MRGRTHGAAAAVRWLLRGLACIAILLLFSLPAQAQVCGDAVLDTATEQCDDGRQCEDGTTACTSAANCSGIGAGTCATRSGDGCDSTCLLESPAGCGDGVTDSLEACDDGNTVDGDGCSALCLTELSCVDDLTNQTNNCTAKDVRITLVTAISVTDGCEFPGDFATVDLGSTIVAGAGERYDIGILIAQDGGTSRTGSCLHTYLPPPLLPNGTCSGGSSWPSPSRSMQRMRTSPMS
jgi:cysteine-rich repeat protein